MREPLANKLEGTSAPFSSDKLNELYWENGMSTAEIADYCTTLRADGGRTSPQTITDWLRKSNIRVRTPGEAISLSCKNPSSAQQTHLSNLQKMGTEAARTSTKAKIALRNGAKKGRRQSAKNRLARRITGLCENGCGKTYSRKPSQYGSRQHHFCSPSCASKYSSHERRLFNSTLRTAAEQHEYQKRKDAANA